MENILLDKKKRNVKIVGKLFRHYNSNVGISENEILLQILA